MKYQRFLLMPLLFLSVILLFSQEQVSKKYRPDYPILIRPQNHNPNFKNFPKKSFYESRNNWQAIIDSTWGPGLPRANKLLIFDRYADALHNEFDGFLSLGMDFYEWDTLRAHYRNMIDSTTSRGGFSAIMSQLANALRDAHTRAVDTGVTWTPLNPGVPLLVLSAYTTIEHFGAVLTAMPDSTLLVLRTIPNHPLGLQPGDIVLGYEGIPWKILVQELLAAGLPFMPNGIGAASAYSDFLLLGAGMNWHLFGTMDIIQYSTGDTLHLSVAPMINLNVPPMLNNEQVEIPGIPFPTFFNEQVVSYGILNNTNIGYIYLFQEWPEEVANQQFAEAVNALKNTNGLIIDMRLNFGGWALFAEAFDILFNDFTLTIEDAYRYGPSTLALVPSGNANWFQIDALPATMYDHPIAVLLGPTCISMGDITAQRLRYHPTVRFFGKSSGASMGDNLLIEDYTEWVLLYSISDMYHLNQPGSYLNRTEFPIDYPVWHNPADAANGIDAVVEEALNWMNNLVYGHDLTIEKHYYTPNLDTLLLEALVENPNSHPIASTVIIHNPDSTIIDSVRLTRKMLTSDSEIWAGKYPAPATEDNFSISLSAYDSTNFEKFTINNIKKFTTIGPLELVSCWIEQILPMSWGYRAHVNLSIINNGSSATAQNVEVELVIEDTTVISILNPRQSFGNIAVGVTVNNPTIYGIFCQSYPLIDTLNLKINLYSNGYLFWQDSTDLIVGIRQLSSLHPTEFTLKQNFPNPFNPTTVISWQLAVGSPVKLTIYNLLGQTVKILVDEWLPVGIHTVEFDGSGLPSGVYLYKIEAGEYVEVRKMVLMK
ncbi:MAG: T9SS type A sorting domain-containing protein [bacterium]|nr:MAG: T9SS type A sorting domain-containing protein [bacterium]